MSVEGDLKDISLISILQMVCLEGRNAGLFVTRRGEEGAVFFHDGEIVHAVLGTLQGEDAVYQLVTWKDGFFRMSDQGRVPSKTIGKSWNNLLLEGMKRIDEQRHAATAATAAPAPIVREVSRADTAHDEGLEFDLISLLANVEQTLARLDEKKLQRQPSLFVQALSEMVNQVAAFAVNLREDEAKGTSLERLVNEAGDVYPSVRLLLVQQNRLSTKMVENLENGRTGMNIHRPSLRQVCQGLTLVLQSYFSVFEQCYRTPALREQWGETYNVFIVELKRALAKAPF